MTRRVLLAVVILALAYGGLLAGSSSWASAPPPHASCPASGVAVQVDPAARVLSLCRAGVEDASFRVALGRSGLDKRSEGDGRTPRGQYKLEPSRPSARYHLFLPVDYPTDAQAKQGYTGSAIGVHGPHVAFAWLGHATAWPDWTLGCIAVGTRADIERIAQWVNANAAQQIIIL
jgi:L,D-peptidoglycan transpeptidase YkuD (ErfK/YbiS/YcfS/YnhG family)